MLLEAQCSSSGTSSDLSFYFLYRCWYTARGVAVQSRSCGSLCTLSSPVRFDSLRSSTAKATFLFRLPSFLPSAPTGDIIRSSSYSPPQWRYLRQKGSIALLWIAFLLALWCAVRIVALFRLIKRVKARAAFWIMNSRPEALHVAAAT